MDCTLNRRGVASKFYKSMTDSSSEIDTCLKNSVYGVKMHWSPLLTALFVSCLARLETRLKEFCEYMKYTRVKKIHFCLKIGLLRPEMRELMQLFFNSEETSGAVLICAELQIAFRKLGLERNTKRTVI